jgi:hypothetical protein
VHALVVRIASVVQAVLVAPLLAAKVSANGLW